MDKNDVIFNFAPLWGVWDIREFVGSGSIGKVYKVSRKDFNKEYFSAVKFLSIPTKEQYEDIANSFGGYGETVSEYFNDYIKSVVNEINLLYELKGHSNIISYEDHLIKRVANEDRWYIIIRMEYATSLKDFIIKNPLDEDKVIKMGSDICNALILCHNNGILHRDIKEANIFVSKNGMFKLGDFSVSKLLSDKTSAMTKVGTLNYMPPEVISGMPYNKSADIYSLGIVLYKLLNNGRLPFLPRFPNKINQSDVEDSFYKRVSGEPLEDLQIENSELNRIILKACSFKPLDRYQSADELKMDLDNITTDNHTSNIRKLDNKVEFEPLGNNTLNITKATIPNVKTMNNDNSKTIGLFNEQNNIDKKNIIKNKGTNKKKKLIVIISAGLIISFCVLGIVFKSEIFSGNVGGKNNTSDNIMGEKGTKISQKNNEKKDRKNKNGSDTKNTDSVNGKLDNKGIDENPKSSDKSESPAVTSLNTLLLTGTQLNNSQNPSTIKPNTTSNHNPVITAKPETSYSFPNNAKVSGDFFYVRDSSGNVVSGKYINNGDSMTVLDVSYSKQLIKVEYPISGGVQKGYYVTNAANIIKYTYQDRYKNGSTTEIIYDENLNKLGSLNPNEYATPLYQTTIKGEKCYHLVYDTDKGANTKSGFVKVASFNGGFVFP